MSPTSKMATRSCYFLSFIALTVQIEPELKQRHSDSLCKIGLSHQVRHQTSGCYSWLPGHQCSCLLKFAIADRTQWNRLWSRPLSSFGNFVLRISVFCSLWKVGITGACDLVKLLTGNWHVSCFQWKFSCFVVSGVDNIIKIYKRSMHCLFFFLHLDLML